MPYNPEDLGAEFDMHMARAGLTVPAALRPGLLVAFAELRDQTDLLHTRRSAAIEPANVFRLQRIGARSVTQ